MFDWADFIARYGRLSMRLFVRNIADMSDRNQTSALGNAILDFIMGSVFKKGSRVLIEHYRPIVNLCNFSNIFDDLIYNINHVVNSWFLKEISSSIRKSIWLRNEK